MQMLMCNSLPNLYISIIKCNSSWYHDEENVPLRQLDPSHIDNNDSDKYTPSLTFIIPVKKRPLMLLKTLLNLYGKAVHKERLFIRVVAYADDHVTMSIIPILHAISPNIDIRINSKVDLGYDQIEKLYTLGAAGINTTFQTVFSDRAHIITKGTMLYFCVALTPILMILYNQLLMYRYI